MRNIAWSATEKALAAFIILFVGGCTTVAQVTFLSDQNCRHTFVDRMSSILIEQGEKQDVADKLAESTTMILSAGSLGPRPFLVASPSGADYGFLWRKSLRIVCCDCSAGAEGLYSVQEQSDLHRHAFTHRVHVCRIGQRVRVFG